MVAILLESTGSTVSSYTIIYTIIQLFIVVKGLPLTIHM